MTIRREDKENVLTDVRHEYGRQVKADRDRDNMSCASPSTSWSYKLARLDESVAEMKVTLHSTPANCKPGRMLYGDFVEIAATALLCAQSIRAGGMEVPYPAESLVPGGTQRKIDRQMTIKIPLSTDGNGMDVRAHEVQSAMAAVSQVILNLVRLGDAGTSIVGGDIVVEIEEVEQ